MTQADIELDTLEARCGNCGEKFGHPDFGELAYGSFIFYGENGRVCAYCHTTDAVTRLIEVLLPENCGAEIYQSALAELADPMLGQKLQTAIRCPKCASSNLDYWGGKKTGSMWVKPAAYSNPRKRRVEIMNTYREPEEWKGFYRRHK